MRSAFYDFTALQNDDFIAITNRAKTVRDDEARTTATA
jgi:hypothetical protein